MSWFCLGPLVSDKVAGMPRLGRGLLLGQDVTTQEALSCTSTDSEENDSDLCFDWEPWIKGPAQFWGERYSVAKRRRGPAGNPVQPGETLLGGRGQEWGTSGPTQSLGRLPCCRSASSTTLESLLSLPCWGTLCFVLLETCFHHVGGPASSAMKSSFTKVPYPLPP